MKEMDSAHVSTWLHCLTSLLDLDYALGPKEHHQLPEWLDLPPSYGGIGLKSLTRSANEEYVGSFAGIASSLVEFCKKTTHIYWHRGSSRGTGGHYRHVGGGPPFV